MEQPYQQLCFLSTQDSFEFDYSNSLNSQNHFISIVCFPQSTYTVYSDFFTFFCYRILSNISTDSTILLMVASCKYPNLKKSNLIRSQVLTDSTNSIFLSRVKRAQIIRIALDPMSIVPVIFISRTQNSIKLCVNFFQIWLNSLLKLNA